MKKESKQIKMNQSTASPANDFNLEQWSTSSGSIYVKYVPSNMGKEELTYIFCAIGKVSRVDIVNSAPNKQTGACYRMAFIHFEFWHRTQHSVQLRHKLISQFPNPVHFWSHHIEFATQPLSLMVNTRPVPKTIYNVDQLSDMYHRLREEYNDTVSQLRKEIDELKSTVSQLTSAKETIEVCESQMNLTKSRSTRDPLIYKEFPLEECGVWYK